MKLKRNFTAALNSIRCKQDIKLKDGSGAQCQRARKIGDYCIQHAKILAK